MRRTWKHLTRDCAKGVVQFNCSPHGNLDCLVPFRVITSKQRRRLNPFARSPFSFSRALAEVGSKAELLRKWSSDRKFLLAGSAGSARRAPDRVGAARGDCLSPASGPRERARVFSRRALASGAA